MQNCRFIELSINSISSGKLTREQVIEIREKYKEVNQYSKIAREYKVDRTTIRDVITGQSWRNI